MLAQRVSDFVAHDGGRFVIGQLQLGEDAAEKADAAARHAEGVDLVGAEQIDLPVPFRRFRIPARGVGNHALGDVAQADYLGMVGRRQRVLLLGFLHQLQVLLLGLGFDRFGRCQLAPFRHRAHWNAVLHGCLAGIAAQVLLRALLRSGR